MQALFDPFSGFSLVPSQDDWLGLTGRIQNSQPQRGAIKFDIGSGALVADADGKSWVMLRPAPTGNAFDMNLPLQVASCCNAAATRRASPTSTAGGQRPAVRRQRPSNRRRGNHLGRRWRDRSASCCCCCWPSGAWRVWLAFVPVLVGVLFGAVVCVALFGRMHVMTLVLGSSLIGVAVDYPLHYLSKSWSLKPWRSWPALRLTLPG